MIGYLIRRLLQAVIVVIGVTIITFILLHMLGNPVVQILGPRHSPANVKALTQQLGLNLPLPVQYLHWLWNLLQWNLGHSYRQNNSVAGLLAQRLPNTLLLVGTSTVLAIVLAIPLGIMQAVRRNRPDDYIATGLSFIFYSMPTFWLGLLLIILFSAQLGWLPGEAPQSQGNLFSQLNALVLPVMTLTLVTVALFSRYMRSSMLENLVQDYVRTAKAKGVSSRVILFKHVLRNALIPVLTLIGLSIPGILSGAVVTESVFNYPGMGYLFVNAAVTADFPVLLGVTFVVGIATVIGSLVADILYAVADPRIRYVS
ncbi:MAG: ABC transporter permease [Candidatus Dormibacteria bacterium]